MVTASSSDVAILAPGGIALGGGGANRTLTLTPVAGASGGPVTVTVDVSDGILVTSTSFQLTVTAVNDAPAGTDKTFTIIEDTPYTLTTADFGYSDGNDAPANAFQAVTFTTLPAAGTLTNNGVAVGAGASVSTADIAAGRLVYTPALNGNGIAYAAFTFQVQDDGGTVNGGADLDPVAHTLTFDVSPVNDAAPVNTVPVAQTTDEDKALQFRLSRGNAITVSDVDGGILTTTVSTSDGTLFVQSDPKTTITGNRSSAITISGLAADINVVLDGLRFSSADDSNGSATLTVTTSDDGSLSSSDSIAVAVTAVTDIVPDAVSTQVDTPVTINVLGNDTFENSGATITRVNGSAITDGAGAMAVTNGSVALVSGRLVFTPQTGFVGMVPSFSYTVTSGGVDETANVDVTVSGAAPPVVMVPGAQTANEDTPTVFSTANGNAVRVADADSVSLTTTVSASNGTLTARAFAGATLSNNGSAAVTISGTAAAINGALDGMSYAGAADYNGRATLTVATGDGTLLNSETIAVTMDSVVDIVPDSVGTSENTAVSFNAVTGTNGASADSFEDPGRTVTEVTQGANGTVSFTAAGVLTYTPGAAYIGADSFSYTVSSGGVTEVATVNVTIALLNRVPVNTVPGAQTVDEDTVLAIAGISVNDLDGNLATTQLTAGNGTLTVSLAGGASISAGANASSTLTLSGSQAQIDAALATLAYQGSLNFNGTDTLTVLAIDSAGTPLTDSDTVAVTVVAVNDAPVVANDGLAATEDTPVTFAAADLLANDSDVDTPNAALTIASVTSGAGGTAVLNADGSVTFTPSASFNGAADFAYTVTDGALASTAPATVTVRVVPVNNAPVAINDNLAATEGTPVTFAAADLLANDTDVDTPNAALTIASVASGAGGTAVLNADGSVTFTPNANFNGAADFAYTVTDGTLTSAAAATVTVGVTAVNDAPVAASDNVTATEGTPVTFAAADLLANDTDVDTPNAALTIASVASGAGGTAVLNADGSVTFTPNANFNGAASFTYTVTDGALTSTAAATVTVGVAAVNDAVPVPEPLPAPEPAPAPPPVAAAPAEAVSEPSVEPVPAFQAPPETVVQQPAEPAPAPAGPAAAPAGPAAHRPHPGRPRRWLRCQCALRESTAQWVRRQKISGWSATPSWRRDSPTATCSHFPGPWSKYRSSPCSRWRSRAALSTSRWRKSPLWSSPGSI